MEPGSARQQRPAQSEPARRGPRHPPGLFPRRRRRRFHQHVFLDRDRPSRLRHGGHRLRAQPCRRHAGARGGRGGGKRRRPPPFRRRRARPDQPHGVDLARREQSRLPRHQLRPVARRLWRADQGPDRRRRRSAVDRNHLRHAQRQGRDLRDRGSLRGARHRPAGDDLRYHHRPLGPLAVGANAGRVLEFGQARQSGHRGLELRTRRSGNARPYRRNRPPRRYFRVRLPERRAAQRIRLLRREPRIHGRAAGRVRRRRPGQRGRRLLRHHAGTHRGHRQSRGGQSAAPNSGIAAAVAAVRAGELHAHAGNPVRQYRRAHQRHRLGEIQEADHRRRLRGGVEHRARAGRERRAGDRRQHGRGPARLRSRDGDLPQSDCRRTRHRARPGHGR